MSSQEPAATCSSSALAAVGLPDGTKLPSASFTLEDTALVRAAAAALSSIAILGPELPELPVLYASGRCCELWGCSKVAVLGDGLAQAMQLTPSSVEQLEAALEHSATVCLQLEAAQPIMASFVPVDDASSGQLLYWLACFGETAAVEVAGEAATEAGSEDVAADEEGKRHAASAEFAPAVFVLGSDGGAVKAVNSRFVELAGYRASELSCSSGSSSWRALLGPDSAEDLAPKVDAAVSGCYPGAWVVLLYRKDGSCWWSYLSVYPLPSGTLCIAVDATAASLKSIGTYTMGRVIGQGTYGTVRIGRDQITGEVVAMKLVDTRTLRHLDELQQLQDEVAVLSTLRHPRIIRLFGTQQLQDRICLIMEYAPGGSLKQYMDMQESRVLGEARAKHFFEQMVNAVDYCHRRRVVHRDLKPENILLDENGDIKIADFGLAGITTPFDESLSETCGTIEFTAPEVLMRQQYVGTQADAWSLGAVLYEMLAGKSPFKAPTSAAIVKAACRGVYDPLPDHISTQCKDLVAGLLTVDPALRMAMEQVVCHPWLLGEMALAGEETGTATATCQGATARRTSSSGESSSLSFQSEKSEVSSPSSQLSRQLSTRHNSLRLVVPGMDPPPEELPPVLEENESSSSAGGSAATSKLLSPRRSLPAPQPATRDPIRRTRSITTAPSTKPSRTLTAPPERSHTVHTVQLAFGGHDAQPSAKVHSRSQRTAAC